MESCSNTAERLTIDLDALGSEQDEAQALLDFVPGMVRFEKPMQCFQYSSYG